MINVEIFNVWTKFKYKVNRVKPEQFGIGGWFIWYVLRICKCTNHPYEWDSCFAHCCRQFGISLSDNLFENPNQLYPCRWHRVRWCTIVFHIWFTYVLQSQRTYAAAQSIGRTRRRVFIKIRSRCGVYRIVSQPF